MSTTIVQSKQPDIDYNADKDKYLARVARNDAENPDRANVALPDGFPKQVDGAIIWEGKDWTSEDQWVYKLSVIELEEIDNALDYFKSLKKSMGYISRDTFPLPMLGPKLKDLAHELHSGRGFFVLRTLPIDDYSRADIVIVYAGISSYIAPSRGQQDLTGAVVSHIKDLSVSHAYDKGSVGSPAYTTAEQPFHTDVGDVVSLMVLQTAAEGGISMLSSGGRVYNELASTRPDIIRTLSEPWPLDSYGANPAYTTRPVLFHEDGHAIIQYARRLLTGYGHQKRSPNIPPLTELQAEALDAVHFSAEKFSLQLNFQKGDIQYINSMGLLHARDAYKDGPGHTRHLLRFWLRNDELAWKTPKALEPTWKKMYSVGPDEQRFPLEPEMRRKERDY